MDDDLDTMEKTQATNFAGLAIFGNEALDALFDLRWLMVFVFILILVDFRFGISAAQKRNEKIRWSRAWRRTVNKFLDYNLYLVFGAVLGLAIAEPIGVGNHVVTAAVGISIGGLFEIQSIIQHVCELHGVKFTFNLWKFALAIIKSRSETVGNALEEGAKSE